MELRACVAVSLKVAYPTTLPDRIDRRTQPTRRESGQVRSLSDLGKKRKAKKQQPIKKTTNTRGSRARRRAGPRRQAKPTGAGRPVQRARTFGLDLDLDWSSDPGERFRRRPDIIEMVRSGEHPLTAHPTANATQPRTSLNRTQRGCGWLVPSGCVAAAGQEAESAHPTVTANGDCLCRSTRRGRHRH